MQDGVQVIELPGHFPHSFPVTLGYQVSFGGKFRGIDGHPGNTATGAYLPDSLTCPYS